MKFQGHCPPENAKYPKVDSITKIKTINDNCIIKAKEKSSFALFEMKKEESNESTEVLPYEEQAINYEWAVPIETSVSDAFQIHELLDGVTLENVECRTSICKVTMLKHPEGSHHQVTLAKMALSDTGVKISSSKFSSGQKDNQVVFYFSTD